MLMVFAVIMGIAYATPVLAKFIDKHFKRKPFEVPDDGLIDIYNPKQIEHIKKEEPEEKINSAENKE
jgi:hypothetical protein